MPELCTVDLTPIRDLIQNYLDRGGQMPRTGNIVTRVYCFLNYEEFYCVDSTEKGMLIDTGLFGEADGKLYRTELGRELSRSFVYS